MEKIKLFIDRYLVIVLLVLGLLFSFVCLFSVKLPSVKAAEGTYMIHYSYVSDDGVFSSYVEQEATLSSQYPLFIYLQVKEDDLTSYRVGFFNGKKCDDVVATSKVYVDYFLKRTILRSDGSVVNISSSVQNPNLNFLSSASNIPLYSGNSFTSSAYVFDSLESAESYYLTGNKDGVIQKPDPDYKQRHDFSQDEYDADVPIPELSNFSHNGFRINNSSDDLFIDIVVESKIYGLFHYKATNNNKFLADKSWVYSSHYWNIADYSDLAINNSEIDIKRLWNIDNSSALIGDLKSWKSEYPTNRSLPDYSFWSYGTGIWYELYKLYLYDSDRSDANNLKYSGQASTTYYVRFYSYDKENGLRYGKWVAYTFSSDGSIGKDDVAVGDVQPDDDGDPHVVNPKPGKQDPDDGSVDYTPDGSGGSSTIDSSDLWATLRSLVNSMGDVPDMVAACFSFLPSWLTVMIAFGIAAMVVLRIVGR